MLLATLTRWKIKRVDDIAIMMTAWRRPQYLRRTLESWTKVRGVQDVATFHIALDPSDRSDDMLKVIGEFGPRLPITVHINEQRYGVSENPVESGTDVFIRNPYVNFIVMAEEDLVVSDDVLEYMEWSSAYFSTGHSVLCVCAHSPDDPSPDADPSDVVVQQRFRVWVWGTWRDRWFEVLEPSWDRNYSSGTADDPSCGFDYNIDRRVMPQGGYVAALPLASRSQNIGQFEGVHADASGFRDTYNPSFREHFETTDYRFRP